jgi:serralysin
MKKIFFALTVFCSYAVAAQPPVKMIEKAIEINRTIKNVPVTYDFSKVKICVEKAAATNNQLPPRKSTAGYPVPKINSDGTISQIAVVQQPLTSATDKMWNPGEVITVYLSPNNGSDFIREQVKQYARVWEQYANIKFDFINNFNAAKIKVDFINNGQSWSWVGRDVLFNPLQLYTMNFGWFDAATLPDEFSRVVTHEFGHALGFLHEQQSPVSPIQWNLPKTYAYFKKSDNWDPAMVDAQVINKYSRNNTNFSSYDRFSIMHYEVPPELLLSGPGAPSNTQPSETDKKFAAMWYPSLPTGSNTTGILRTNDDCDAINFNFQYNAVPADKVEFVLMLGQTNTKQVTWWKQVGIPKTNNTETFLWVQNHSLIKEENRTSITVQIPFNEIDMNKSISFWKAKLLGVHTLLNYKWNVLQAVRGGCRITLTWNQDSCIQ